MKVKNPVKCKGCGIMTRNLHGKDYDYCKRCFNKIAIKNKIPIGPLLYDEEVKRHTTAYLSLTNKHINFLEKRLNFLFPERKKEEKKLNKLSSYLRMLIDKDLEDSESINKANLEVKNADK